MMKSQLRTKPEGSKCFLLIVMVAIAIALLLSGCFGIATARNLAESQGPSWEGISNADRVDAYCASLVGQRGGGLDWTGCVNWADKVVACSTASSCAHEEKHLKKPGYNDPLSSGPMLGLYQ